LIKDRESFSTDYSTSGKGFPLDSTYFYGHTTAAQAELRAGEEESSAFNTGVSAKYRTLN
jgi:hypothetical protein